MLLIEKVEANTGAAQAAFNRVDEALNLVMPGSSTHERYRDIGSVGLAVVIGEDNNYGLLTYQMRNAYSPFNPKVLQRLSFSASNQQTRPETWAPKDTDREILGGIPPENMGRFTAFALAKINALIGDNTRYTSARTEESISRGKIGLAGGQRLMGNVLLGVSGLWEVHDHFVGSIYKDEFNHEVERAEDKRAAVARTPDDVAGRIETVFGRIQKLHEGVEAADLAREAIVAIVSEPNRVLNPTSAS